VWLGGHQKHYGLPNLLIFLLSQAWSEVSFLQAVVLNKGSSDCSSLIVVKMNSANYLSRTSFLFLSAAAERSGEVAHQMEFCSVVDFSAKTSPAQ